jgi:hypothetical protein
MARIHTSSFMLTLLPLLTVRNMIIGSKGSRRTAWTNRTLPGGAIVVVRGSRGAETVRRLSKWDHRRMIANQVLLGSRPDHTTPESQGRSGGSILTKS